MSRKKKEEITILSEKEKEVLLEKHVFPPITNNGVFKKKGDVDVSTQDKYWIKNGIAVHHVDYPKIKMRVQQLRKVTKEINDGKGGKKNAEFIAGVTCTWLDKDHKFQTGLFHTKEILPWKE